MLFALDPITDWRTAAAFLLVIVGNIAANWWQNRKPRQSAVKAAQTAEKAAVTAEKQAVATCKSLDAVHETLNGNGILGTLKAVQKDVVELKALHADHATKDDERFDEIKTVLHGVNTAVKQGIVIPPTTKTH